MCTVVEALTSQDRFGLALGKQGLSATWTAFVFCGSLVYSWPMVCPRIFRPILRALAHGMNSPRVSMAQGVSGLRASAAMLMHAHDMPAPAPIPGIGQSPHALPVPALTNVLVLQGQERYLQAHLPGLTHTPMPACKARASTNFYSFQTASASPTCLCQAWSAASRHTSRSICCSSSLPACKAQGRMGCWKNTLESTRALVHGLGCMSAHVVIFTCVCVCAYLSFVYWVSLFSSD